jgi:hypothetical protein
MRRYLTNVWLFSIPFLVYVILVVVVDPFNYFSKSDIISNETKFNNAFRLNNRLWNCIEFKRNPKTNIVLGDSRSVNINPTNIKALTGNDYFNFSFYGGNLLEEIESFWYANEHIELKNVYWGINFNCWNDLERNNRIEDIKVLIKRPHRYIFSRITAQSMIRILYAVLLEKGYKVGTPAMTKEQFWKHQLDGTIKRYYSKYKYPEYLRQRLLEVVTYCKAKQINIVFYIPPTHIDLQNKINEYGLMEYNQRFIKDLAKLGIVYDFDFPNSFTEDSKNFNDPFHTVSDSLVSTTLWGKARSKVKIYQ